MKARAIRRGPALAVAALVAAACGGTGTETSGETAANPSATSQQPADARERPAPGPLWVVEIEAGEAIQIRSLEAITGDVAFLGIPNMRSAELAIED